MHYIRFLKHPALRQRGNEHYISGLLTVTTDLGDDFYADNVELLIILSINDSEIKDPLVRCTIRWRAGMRALPFDAEVEPLTKLLPYFVEVAAKNPTLAEVHYVGAYMHLPVIVAARAVLDVAPRGSAEADRMLLRTIKFGNDDELLIWEDAGDSIARHVWDAGMAVATLFANSQQLSKDLPRIASLLDEDRSQLHEVIEIGTGTGLLGLGLAKASQRVNVLLTDISEVEGLVNRNLASNKVASGSTVQFQALDWNDRTPPTITEQQYDLIIASDVTYNPDSSGALVRTIARIVRSSPRALVLIAMKKRHASEDVFFTLMTESLFSITEKAEILAPTNIDRDDKETVERIELFTFRR